nr:hypothetical protein [Actinomadura madurae]
MNQKFRGSITVRGSWAPPRCVGAPRCVRLRRRFEPAQPLPLRAAEDVGEDEAGRERDEERRQHGDDDVGDVDLEGDRHPGRRAAPRHPVEDRADDAQQHGDDQRVDADPAVDRIHRGHGDQHGRGAVAVQADDHDQDRGAHHDPHRIVAHRGDDPADERLEQPAFEHHQEIHQGEDEHHRGRRGFRDSGDHHVAQIGTEPADQSEYRGDEDERGDRRQPFRHDQCGEEADRPEPQESQHGVSSLL